MGRLPADRVFVIAEAGVNHNGDMRMAERLIDVAADAGADAVKFQSFRADRLASAGAPKADYQIASTGAEETQHQMLKRLELSEADHRRLLSHCAQRGIRFLSTPFDESSADFLDTLGIGIIKIPSGEVTNLPFLEHIAAMGRPVILSTGMATLDEVRAAVETLRAASCDDLTLLHCLSNYPADPAESNLRAMQTMAEAFGVPVGYSDHTPGIVVSLAAVALGARVIEKHFTLDKSLPGPDHAASLEPSDLKALVRGIRIVESALGDGVKAPAPSEIENRNVIRKSLVAVVDIAAGEEISPHKIAILRPGTGLLPGQRDQAVGKRATRPIPAGTPLQRDMLA